jgi:membrane-bound lytic murein transglycosylase A
MRAGRADAQTFGGRLVAGLFGAIVFFAASGARAEGPLQLSGTQLQPIKWSELAGWTGDDHLAAFAAYQASCQALRKARRSEDRGQISGALWNVCRNALALRPRDGDAARAFFEQNFQPFRISRLGEVEGFLTGYFEPVVAGSRFPSPEFHVPLYRRPRDLVAAGYNPAAVAFPNKGVRIGRRNENSELLPYHDRAAIEAGALDGQKLEICWLKDPFDLLTIQIEGSARVILEDGTPVRVSYDSHNGYSYSSIERVLVERNLIPRKEMSIQRIRDWMAAHPDEAAKVRATNRSYVFFRITGLSNEGEPVGAQGVPLTPGRSIAVDRLHEYGTPFFIEADLPIGSVKAMSAFRRLMIAQDTGSAMVGPARADLYWGAGDDAGRIAGRIRHPGRFAMLLPRELDMIAAGAQMPLPVPRPKIIEAKKEDAKSRTDLATTGQALPGKQTPMPKQKIAALDIKKRDGKSKAEPAKLGESAAAKHMPLLKPKTTAVDIKKQEGKSKAEPAKLGESAAGKHMPLAKPKTTAADIKKQEGKSKAEPAKLGESAAGKHMPLAKPKTTAADIKKQEGKSKAEPAKLGESAAAKHMPLPKPKTTAVGIKKQDGKSKAESAKSGEVVAGKHVPLPKPSSTAIEMKKQEGKIKATSARAAEDGKAAPKSGSGKPALRERATAHCTDCGR